MLRATDEEGNVLPEFEKVLDIDIKAAAETALGKELEQNLLSVVFDYEGNLWFATGGFRIYPEREQQGVLGYIARTAIDAILNGEEVDLASAVYVYDLPVGEGAENGIAASRDGAVILTNKNCARTTASKRSGRPPMKAPVRRSAAKATRPPAAALPGAAAAPRASRLTWYCSPITRKRSIFWRWI